MAAIDRIVYESTVILVALTDGENRASALPIERATSRGPSPSDADAVVLLGDDVNERIARGHVDAILLADVLGARPGDHLFAAESRRDWDDWIDFFTRTVDPAVRKGLVEVVL